MKHEKGSETGRAEKIQFIFDLDGTVTAVETLPLIAAHFNIREQIDELTRETVKGNIPFIESFKRRVGMLARLPVDEINELLGSVPLYGKLHRFIQDNTDRCAIATGNLECWTEKLCRRIGCAYFCSQAEVRDNKIYRLLSILKKESVVQRYKEAGCRVIYIGEGNNDLEGMRQADISIANGITHAPPEQILSVADYVIDTEEALCRQLRELSGQKE